jgi:protein O-mannosyl-transferase
MPRPRWLAWAVAALAIAAIVAYAPALRAPLLYDDPLVFEKNPSLQRLWPLSVPLQPPPNTPVSGRPVVNYSLALNSAVSEWFGVGQETNAAAPYSTFGFHIGNVLLHLVCGALILGILRRTLRSQRYDAWWAAHAEAGAIAVTALWLLHPIQTEAVDYLAQRTELLVSVCYAGTLYASIRAWDAASDQGRRAWFAAALFVCLLGMGSKEVMISAPIAVILYDRAFRYTTWGQITRGGRSWFYLALLATIGVLIALLAGTPRANTVGFHLGITWYQYLYSQAWALAHYLRLVAWPNRLTLDYGNRPITGPGGIPGLILLGAFGIATLVAWSRANRWGWFGFLGAWFFLLLGPSSSVVPIVTEIAAERRIYLALVSVLVIVVVGVEALRRRLVRRYGADVRSPWLIPGAFVVVCAALAVTTFQRSQLYADPVALWLDLVQRPSRNPRVYDNLAVSMLRRDLTREGDAVGLWRRAVGVDSTYAAGWYKLGVIALSHQQLDDADRDFARALANDPNHPGALDKMGDVLVARGQTTQGIADLERSAIEAQTDTTMIDLGNAYLKADSIEAAVRSFRSALKLDPSRTDVVVFLGALLSEHGHPDEAVPYLEQAVARQPSSGIDRALLSVAYAELARTADAAAAANAAVGLGGNDERVYLFAGEAMLRVERAADAETYCARAVQLSPSDPEALTALGAAKAAQGKRADAGALYRRALGIAPTYQPARDALGRLGGPG